MADRFPEEWVAAMRAPVRRERVSVILSRGGEKQDADIIQNSLYINRKVMGSKFDLGTCCIGEMGVSFTDDNAIDTNYGGALATVVYSLYVGIDTDGSEKWYFSTAGPFIVDGQKARREGNVVTVKAYDILSNFDIEFPKDNIPEFANLYAAVKWLCDVVPLVNGRRFGAMPESEFNLLPNADIVPDFSSGQIVSCRDALMWIAQTTGTCVFYGRKGITFKQYKYTGNMSYDREITAQERDKIEFTDTRTYCAYLSAESAGRTKIYSNIVSWDESWEPKYIKTGGLALPKNPIISNLTEEQQDTVNKNILMNMSCPTRYVKMTGDVDFLLEPLDCTAFTDGYIDIRNMIIAPITEINWKYRAAGKIVCVNVDEYTDPLPDETTAVMQTAEGGISPQAETSATVHSPVYSQDEKARRGIQPKMTELASALPPPMSQFISTFKFEDFYTLGLYDPGGGKCGHIKLNQRLLELSNATRDIYLDLGNNQFVVKGGNFEYQFSPDGIYAVTPNGTCIIDIRWRSIDVNGLMLSTDSEQRELYFNGKRVLTE